MKIGEFGQRVGMAPRTIRFYETAGLVPNPARSRGGYRDYSEADVEQFTLIKAARALGLTLDEIREVLALRDQGEAPCTYVRGIIVQKEREIDQQIRNLRQLRSELRRLTREAAQLPQTVSTGHICCILEHHVMHRGGSNGDC